MQAGDKKNHCIQGRLICNSASFLTVALGTSSASTKEAYAILPTMGWRRSCYVAARLGHALTLRAALGGIPPRLVTTAYRVRDGLCFGLLTDQTSLPSCIRRAEHAELAAYRNKRRQRLSGQGYRGPATCRATGKMTAIPGQAQSKVLCPANSPPATLSRAPRRESRTPRPCPEPNPLSRPVIPGACVSAPTKKSELSLSA